MKQIITAHLLLIISITLVGQNKTKDEKYRELVATNWMSIWDRENSDKTIKIDTIGYDEIPKNLDFRGIVVEALKWSDNTGENIFIQSATGDFIWKEYEKGSISYTMQDKAEIYAYLFRKGKQDKDYKKAWRVYDYIECYGVDWYVGFIPKATTITDLDKNGIAEISIPYVSVCRGGMDPGDMKIIMYENNEKYAVRGTTMLSCDHAEPYGGDYNTSDNLNRKETFKTFLLKRWDAHKCENERFW